MNKCSAKQLQVMQDEYNAAVAEMQRQWQHDQTMNAIVEFFRGLRIGLTVFGAMLVAILVLAVGCSDPAPAAPAPLPKRESTQGRTPNLVGMWALRYGTLVYRYDLKRDGTLSSPPWSGSWSVSGRKLSVIESTNPDNPDSWLCWEVELDGRLRGDGKVTQGSYGGPSGQTIPIRFVPEWMYDASPGLIHED